MTWQIWLLVKSPYKLIKLGNFQMSITSSKISFGTQFKAHIGANHAARHLHLKKFEKEQNKKKSRRVCCVVQYIPRGVGAFDLRLNRSSHRELWLKRKPNTHTPPTIWDKYSPNYVSCRIGFSTLYTSIWGQTGQLQGQWPWWQRTFLGRMSPKPHGVCACLRPSDPRSP